MSRTPNPRRGVVRAGHPHDDMTALDKAGDAYWIETRSLVNDVDPWLYDVVAHGPEWVLIERDSFATSARPEVDRERIWVRYEMIAPFAIVEG